MKILITGVGGPTPRSFAISLKKYSRHYSYELIATDVNPLSVGLYQRDLFSKSYIVPRATDSTYWSVIEQIVKEDQIEYAVVLPEVEVGVWSQRAAEGKIPCKSFLPDPRIAELLIDKALMTAELAEMRLVPLSVGFHRDEKNLQMLTDLLGSPFWVRSTSGTSGLGSLKIDSLDSLRNWIQINPLVKHFLASEYLPGRNLACKMLYFEGQLLRAACAERVNYVMAKVAPSGITGNTSFGRLLNEPEIVHIAEKAMDRLFQKTGAQKHGFFTVDFKEDKTKIPLITEINVRHVAFTQCFAAAGANFAEDTIRLMAGDKTFDRTRKIYEFGKDQIFLRDVDSLPIIMKESDLLR